MKEPRSFEESLLHSARAEMVTPSQYTRPEMFEVGRAIDLVRSYSSGKYSDGYYWER